MAFVKRSAVELAEAQVPREAPKQERSCAELAAGLEDADPQMRRRAAREILHCPDAAEALVSRLKREPDAAVREAILTALVRLDDPSAAAGMAECLRSQDAALRNEVIEAIGHLSGDVSATLRTLLADPDPDVRIFAVNILDSRRQPDVESWLIEVIEQDVNLNVCATAVDLLCEAGTETAIEPLLRLKARFAADAFIQFAASRAIKRIRGV
jgi:HEAT repeat protein